MKKPNNPTETAVKRPKVDDNVNKYSGVTSEDRVRLMSEEAALLSLKIKVKQADAQLKNLNLQTQILEARMKLGSVKNKYQESIGNVAPVKKK